MGEWRTEGKNAGSGLAGGSGGEIWGKQREMDCYIRKDGEFKQRGLNGCHWKDWGRRGGYTSVCAVRLIDFV